MTLPTTPPILEIVVVMVALAALLVAVMAYERQLRLTKMALQNDSLHRFGSLGMQMFSNSAMAQALKKRLGSLYQTENQGVRVNMLNQDLSLRALRLPVLLHFDVGEDVILAEQLDSMTNAWEHSRKELQKDDFKLEEYEKKQNEFQHLHMNVYADMVLQIERGKRAEADEIEKVGRMVFAKGKGSAWSADVWKKEQ